MKQSPYNWVGCHPLYRAIHQGFGRCSGVVFVHVFLPVLFRKSTQKGMDWVVFLQVYN